MSRHAALVACLLLAFFTASDVTAQPASESDPPGGRSAGTTDASALSDWVGLEGARSLYYVVDRRPELRSGPGTGSRQGQLDFRRGVFVVSEEGPWRLVEDAETGQVLGWVEARSLSNVWLLMDKESRTLFVYRGAELIRRLAADVSSNPNDDKVRRSGLTEREHHRIPEGSYFVSGRNPNSQYYRSFMLNYPNAEDARRGLSDGIISHAEFRRIVDAAERFASPPMGTRLGGAIAIHGQGSGRRRAWTRGCVALRDIHMDLLWEIVQVGTPILIR